MKECLWFSYPYLSRTKLVLRQHVVVVSQCDVRCEDNVLSVRLSKHLIKLHVHRDPYSGCVHCRDTEGSRCLRRTAGIVEILEGHITDLVNDNRRLRAVNARTCF